MKRHLTVIHRWLLFFMIACVLIILYAFVAGHYRGISMGWRLIDCSFGLVGMIPLLIIRYHIIQMKKILRRDVAKTDSIFFHRIRISSLAKTPAEQLN